MRLKNGALRLLTVIVLGTLLSFSWWYTILNVRDIGEEEEVQSQFLDLQRRLQIAEAVNQRVSQELTSVLESIKHIIAEKRSATRNQTKETKKDVNITENRKYHVLNAYYYLPHLAQSENSLRPNVAIGQGRTNVSLVLGIPTVKREKQNYLMDTLNSLLYELSQEERSDCIIIVFIAETDVQYVNSLAADIKKSFPSEVQSGLLEVVSPSPGFYPNFTDLKETFGDTRERVKWRTKQNLDYSFLMLYAQDKGRFYVQLEDDIIARTGYFQTMKNVALQKTSVEWMVMEFSQLGFIGKMFNTYDLPLIVEFILMFYKDKPIDWLLDHILWVKACHPEKDAKHCDRQKSSLRIRYKPSLFQHVGTHSSLPGKIQNLKDKDFGKQILHKAHTNPSADITTSLTAYQQFSIEKAYYGENFFWALTPVSGDHITISFHPPVTVKSYLFRSGNIEHPGDKLFNTSVEVQPANKLLLENVNEGLLAKYEQTKDGYVRIGAFVNGVAEGEVPPFMEKVTAVRLFIHSNSSVWVLLSEIFIKTDL